MYVERVKELLQQTELSFQEIANLVGKSQRTIQNINSGKTHRSPHEVYPLRVSIRSLGILRTRLLAPTTDAVLNPHIISPQLLDYIGFLALLGASERCILVFREVYIDELQEVLGRKLNNDEEIAAIVRLKPRYPESLRILIDAYFDPKTRLINLDHWVKTGLILEGEREAIHSLLY